MSAREERGQGEAIVCNLMEMSDLKVPIMPSLSVKVVQVELCLWQSQTVSDAGEPYLMPFSVQKALLPFLWKDGTQVPRKRLNWMKITSQ